MCIWKSSVFFNKMSDTEPRTLYRNKEDDDNKRGTASKQFHSLAGRVTRRVIAPYAQIERKGIKGEQKDEIFMDISRFTVLLEDVVDLDALLLDTANVLKIVTNSTGVFVYKVDNVKQEIILMPQNTTNTSRHEVNIPMGQGQIAAAHVAATKDFLLLSDVPRDCRFAEGLKWVQARTALCMPIVKPDGDCHAVIEFYRTHGEPYNNDVLYMVMSLACWIGAAVQQTQVRITMHKMAHLNAELLMLLHKYFCELASLDTMITDMLAVIKKFMGVTWTRFFIIDRDSISSDVVADMWDDGWSTQKTNMPKKKQKIKFNDSELEMDLSNTTFYPSVIYFVKKPLLVKINNTEVHVVHYLTSWLYRHTSNMQHARNRPDPRVRPSTTNQDLLIRYRLEKIHEQRTPCNLSQERSPAGLVARTGEPLNVRDAYTDERFTKEVEPITGRVVRATLVSPIIDKQGVIGIVQLIGKRNQEPFNAEDMKVFDVFIGYCTLIVHFAIMQQMKVYHSNMNSVYSDLIAIHLHPCQHDYDKLMESQGIVTPPEGFMSFDYYVDKQSKNCIPGMICYMFVKMFNDEYFDRSQLVDFVLTILGRYRNTNPYHNAEHAFCFTHGLFLILINNKGIFSYAETLALMLAGLCHDLDHPGYNNNFLTLIKHPLSVMYKYSNLEFHHYFIAKKIIQDKKLLERLPLEVQENIILELKYNILSTDLAVYFQVRAQLTPLVSDHTFDWGNKSHRQMVKSMLMTASDLIGCCKPFCTAKQIAECVYEEFYNQGDKEREMGYTPLSMMDRRRSLNQAAEQIQFMSVVVLPCLTILQGFFSNVAKLVENGSSTQAAWLEEIETRGQKLWRQVDSTPAICKDSKNQM